MPLSRRHFLRNAAAVSLGFTGFQRLLGCEDPAPYTQAIPESFGPLVRDPNGILDLPEGFSYKVFSRVGEQMTDGFFVPAAHDGMAAFPGPNGLTILVRNHEVNAEEDADEGPFGPGNQLFSQLSQGALYDAGYNGAPCLGGTTTLIYDTRTQHLESHYLSLTGTLRNCAGGPTPWNSWITCEETTQRVGDFCAKDHGYVFEVPASATPSLASPVPIKAMGRFNHEAVAVDPASGIVYQTEDTGDSLIYRFIPNEPGNLLAGGRLQALMVRDQPGLDTRNWQSQIVMPGTSLAVQWIDLDNVEAPDNDLRHRGFEAGAAQFARGEGMWFGRGAVYFACTNGGSAQKGQIWRYTPSPVEGTDEEQNQPGQLELFIEPNDGSLVENADNLTVSPWGDLIVCEDGSGDQYLVGVTPEGKIYKFAHNAVSDSEFAGATFSPDGTTLFVNIQGEGMTLAITGPWKA